jgi:CBS domain-containing protein
MLNTMIGDLFAPSPTLVLAPSTPVDRAVGLMRRYGFSELPVVLAGYLVGVVSEHDLAAALLDSRRPGEIAVIELVPEEFYVGRLEQPLADALTLLARYRLQRIAVIGDDDEFLGMLSEAAIFKAVERGRLQDQAARALVTGELREPLRAVR